MEGGKVRRGGETRVEFGWDESDVIGQELTSWEKGKREDSSLVSYW